MKLIILFVVGFQFISFNSHKDPNVLLQGNWQSCVQADGEYGEQAFEYCILGRCLWNFHMGPRDEFAIFPGQMTPDHIDHSSTLNLLMPSFHAEDIITWRGMRAWTVPTLHLRVSVAQAGGSRDDCDSWVVGIERMR